MLFLLLVLSYYYKRAGRLSTLTISLEELKMKTAILTLACLLLVVPCQAAEKAYSAEAAAKAGQLTHEQQIKQRLKIQQQRLKDIEHIAASERQAIEEWHAKSIQQLVELAASQLKTTDRMLWAEFRSKLSGETTYADSYFWSKFPRTVSILQDKNQVRVGQALKAFELREAMIDSFFLSLAQDFLTDCHFRKMLSDIVESEEQNLLIRTEAQKLLTIMKDLQLRVTHLDNQKIAQLAQLEQWEKDMREHVYKVMRDIKAQPEKLELGVVSAISYDEKGSLCMVDGIDKVLQPGDKINNITVVKIQKDRVEFAKGGRRWVQKIGEPAKPAWK